MMCPGRLLCDEQGLGKTQEMYGPIALKSGLRRAKAEVLAAWREKLLTVLPLLEEEPSQSIATLIPGRGCARLMRGMASGAIDTTS